MGILDKEFVYTPAAQTDIRRHFVKHGMTQREHHYDELSRLRTLRRQLDAFAKFKDGKAIFDEAVFEEMLNEADGCGNDK